MDALNTLAWTMILLFAGWWAFLRFQCWRADRRIRQLHNEIIGLAREAGIPDSELETYCDGCKRFSVGPVCPYC